MPEEEERELAQLYQDKGLSAELAEEVARELTLKDPLRAHADAELQIDPDNLTSPWQAVWASLVSFTIGGLIPLLAIGFPPTALRVWTCGAAVIAGLALTGWISANLGAASVGRAILRNLGVGALTMLITYYVGVLFGLTIN
jgi:VIT1/CCC1 family predicted Fe2+/Mn2+ transporter